MAQVDTDGKHNLFLHEQPAHLHAGNTQTKLQTWTNPNSNILLTS